MKVVVLVAALLASGCAHPIFGEPERRIVVVVTNQGSPVVGAHVRVFTELGFCGQVTPLDGIVRCLVPNRQRIASVEVRAINCVITTTYLDGLPETDVKVLMPLVCIQPRNPSEKVSQ